MRISLFGSLRILGAGGEIRVTRTVRSLLAYLLIHRQRMHGRDALIGLFWPDHAEERARSCLSTALWRLRRALEPDGTARGAYLLTNASGAVGFNERSDCWLDLAVFEAAASRIRSRPFHAASEADARELDGALALYSGDLLEGCYEEWAQQERGRLRCLYLDGLVWLMRHHGYYGAYEKSIECGQRALQTDPLREEIHREVMRLYLETGQRSQAMQQYEICREGLANKLGLAPAKDTVVWYEKALQRPDVPPSLSHPPPADPATLGYALGSLQDAIRRFDDAKNHLDRAVSLVERLAGVRRGGERLQTAGSAVSGRASST